MRRFLVTLCTVAALSVAFRVYSAILDPLTALRTPLPSQIAEAAGTPEPLGMVIQAQRDFPDVPWAHAATQEYHLSEHACVYTKQLTTNPGSGRTIHVAPVALIWRNPKRPEAAPLRIVADSGELEFENKFYDQAIALTDAKPGRIVAAQLNGAVRIDGPDGLVIEGRQFTFSEQSSQLYSDSPVRFAFGPTATNKAKVVGQGERLNLTFQPSEESILGKDMPRIGKPALLVLRQNVDIQAAYEQDKKPNRAHVSSQGPFEFNFIDRTAVFDTGVVVERWLADGSAPLPDTLRGDWLSLQFDQELESPTREPRVEGRGSEFGGLLDNLVFRRLRALGTRGPLGGLKSRLTITSESRNLSAEMEELTYDAVQRHIMMKAEDRVLVVREATTLESPRIDAILHADEDDPDKMRLAGPGRLRLTAAQFGTEPVTANWTDAATLLPDPETGTHVLQLDRDAQLVVPQQFGVSAARIQLWIDLRQAITDAETEVKDPLTRPLALKKASATGDAVFASERMIVKRSDDIELVIVPGKLPATLSDNRSRLKPGEEPAGGKPADDPPVIVEADKLALQVVHDPGSEKKIDVRRVEGVGKVFVRQERPKTPSAQQPGKIAGALEIRGVRFVVDNEGGLRQTMAVFGETDQFGKTRIPGSISLGTARIEGLQVTLTRDENMVKVHGPGGLRMPLTESLNQKKLDQPQMLDVVWSERMAFDGLTARFWGQVTASIPEDAVNISRLTCEELSARLNQRINFSSPPDGDAKIKLELVQGSHNVELQAYELDTETKTRFSAMRRGKFHAFEFSQISGEYTLHGPGHLQNWSFGDNVRFAPNDAAQANQAIRPGEQKWRYSKLSFEGNVVGNLHRRDAVVKSRVEFLSAPVESPADVFHRDGLSEDTPQSSNAVWLGCEELRIRLEEAEGQERSYISLLAMGDSALPIDSRNGAELEGRLFRATADVLEYYERQGKFILRGLGKKDAVLHYRLRPGEAAQSSANRRIEFNPAKREVQAFGSAGLSGGSF